MDTVHQEDADQAHLNLKIDLGQKIATILREHYGGGAPVSGAVGEILDLLGLESQKSFLTKRDSAQLRAKLTELTQVAYEAGSLASVTPTDRDWVEVTSELMVTNDLTHRLVRSFSHYAE